MNHSLLWTISRSSSESCLALHFSPRMYTGWNYDYHRIFIQTYGGVGDYLPAIYKGTLGRGSVGDYLPIMYLGALWSFVDSLPYLQCIRVNCGSVGDCLPAMYPCIEGNCWWLFTCNQVKWESVGDCLPTMYSGTMGKFWWKFTNMYLGKLWKWWWLFICNVSG